MPNDEKQSPITLDIYLDSGYTVVVMTNYGGGVEVVSGEIQKVIQGLVSGQ